MTGKIGLTSGSGGGDRYDYDLVCIGSGPAGQRAAVQAAKLGKRVAIVERRGSLGGVCLQTGTIPSKTFREAVRSFSSSLSFDNGLGLSPRHKPTIDQLLGRVNQVMVRESEIQQGQLQRNDIDIIVGTARFVSDHELVVDVPEGIRTVTADKVLIAVGTVPANPPGVKPDGRVVISSDGVIDMTKLPRTMVVVGAGVIGIEYASMFARLGVEVTVIDARKRVLEFLDEEIVDELVYQLRQLEVTLRLGEKVEQISVFDDPTPQGLIHLESGKKMVAEVILYCAGRQGATGSLGLDGAGLVADDRGRLKVNDCFQTEAENIYAAGDVIGFPALAATSSEQGRLAACYMFGAKADKMADHFPIGIYSIPEISMVGATEQELTEGKVPYEIGVARYREISRGQILGDDTGLLKLIFHRDTGRLLGVHSIGTGATELIHVGQAVLALGGGLDYFINTVFNYPTLAECYKVAAHNAANKLKAVRAASKTTAASAKAARDKAAEKEKGEAKAEKAETSAA